jgi:hypothetical protein
MKAKMIRKSKQLFVSLKMPALIKVFKNYDDYVEKDIVASQLRTFYIKVQGVPKIKGYRDNAFVNYDVSLRFTSKERRRRFLNLIEDNMTHAAPIINKLEKRKSKSQSGYDQSVRFFH